MSKDLIQGNWTEVKGKLLQQWSNLTPEDVSKMKGNHDELSSLLQKKYGYKKDAVEREIEAFVTKFGYKKN